MRKSLEQQHLEAADSHIEAANRRIAEQEARIASGRLLGNALEDALALLESMRASLQASEEHRALIIRTLEDIAAGRR